MLLIVVAVQLAAVRGLGRDRRRAGRRAPFAVLVGPWALFVWLRLIVGLVFPLVVSWAAVRTARTRSMESATGLLYINVGVDRGRHDPRGRAVLRRRAARVTGPAAGSGVAVNGIRVRVRLFAIQRELVGAQEVPLELPAGRDDRGRVGRARGARSRARAGPPAVRFARNAEYADADTTRSRTATSWRSSRR